MILQRRWHSTHVVVFFEQSPDKRTDTTYNTITLKSRKRLYLTVRPEINLCQFMYFLLQLLLLRVALTQRYLSDVQRWFSVRHSASSDSGEWSGWNHLLNTLLATLLTNNKFLSNVAHLKEHVDTEGDRSNEAEELCSRRRTNTT